MSAINSSSDDRDLEAIRRAQRAHEPSMEEILASIRNIIADEREAVKSAAPKAAPQRAALPASGPQIVYSKDDSPPQRVAAEPSQQRAESMAPSDANTPKVVWRQPLLTDSQAAAGGSPRNEEPLLSPEANEAVVSSFEALSANLALRSAELADGLVREMLRPMLKQWLDDNLPTMVERLVRAEIERVARGC
jgi:cell pole-organizing protein PopZ